MPMKRLIIAILITLSFPLTGRAGDSSGNFAAKGLAALPCSTFVKERGKLSQTYAETMAWLTGFITAYNYAATDTYDIVPWQSAELLSSLLASRCTERPDDPFVIAVKNLLDSLAEDRLRAGSEIITISVDGQNLNIYKDTVFRIQTALKEKGYLKMRWANGDYDRATAAAMKDFQSANRLGSTGVPDQQSLMLLFLK